MEVRDEEQCRELFLRFYRTGELFERGGGDASEFSLPAKDAMRLTAAGSTRLPKIPLAAGTPTYADGF